MHTTSAELMSDVELCTPELFPSCIIGTPTEQTTERIQTFIHSPVSFSFQSHSCSLIHKDLNRKTGHERTERDPLFDSHGRLVLLLTQSVWTNTPHCLNRTSAAAWSERCFMCSIISVRLLSDTPSLYLSQALTHNHSIEGRYELYTRWRVF